MTVYGMTGNMTGKIAKTILLGFVLVLGGCGIFGGGSASKIEAAEEVYKIGVNAYLWRATLDTLSFMPMRSVDDNGGVILTEWMVSPRNSSERTKVDVIITGRKLSADSLKVTVHRQKKITSGWQDIGPRPGAAINIGKAILMQARLLRRDNAPTR